MNIAHIAPDSNEPDGWIEWKGGERPVPAGTLVQVRTTHPERFEPSEPTRLAETWRWSRDDHPTAANIIAYRVVP